MKTFYKILSVCLAVLCVVIYTGRSDRVAELETERDIYQSRAEAAETALNAKREITLPEYETTENEPDALPMEYAGEFDVTANCCEAECSMCGGTGITASGAPQVAGVTAGANFEVLPAGTWIYIEGVGIRQVQDTGPDCPENHIDVAVPTHDEALAWSGYGTHKVWILQEDNHAEIH